MNKATWTTKVHWGSRALTVVAMGALLVACSDDGDSDAGDGDASMRTLSMSYQGLPALGDGFVYEGWLIVDGAPVSTGRFTVDAAGALSPSTFELDAAVADAGTTFILTIEPAVGDDPAPADTHVLAGDMSNGESVLTIDHTAALGDDFTAAAGTFILATPSSADMTDDNQGIWFLDPSSGEMMPSLELPTLPAGWVYEGWVVDVSSGEPMPLSTGTFTDVATADSDQGGATAGPEGTPPFPGQDYISPARDLTQNHMAVISIEPMPDDSPAPFQLKPLASMIGSEVGGMNAQTIANAIGENTIGGSVKFE